MSAAGQGEIVTLQLGHLANHVGAHFWNTQAAQFVYDPAAPASDINHDILHRRGTSVHGTVETFTPRLLVFDLKGSFGPLAAENALYRALDPSSSQPRNGQNHHATWAGSQQVVRAEPAKTNAFLQSLDEQVTEDDQDQQEQRQDNGSAHPEDTEKRTVFDLDNDVDVWADYLGVYYHPRSLCPITEYLHGASPEFAFDLYPQGTELLHPQGDNYELYYEDRLRHFVEECDHLQAFHFFSSSSLDGFGGLTAALLGELRADFAKTPVVLFDVSQKGGAIAARSRENMSDENRMTLNRALALDAYFEHEAVVIPMFAPADVPVGFGPSSSYKPTLPYHTSALMAAAIDCATMPYRMVSQVQSIHAALAPIIQSKLVSLSLGLPTSLESTVQKILLNDSYTPIDFSPARLAPSRQRPYHLFGETLFMRGLGSAMPLFPSSTVSLDRSILRTPQLRSIDWKPLADTKTPVDLLHRALTLQEPTYDRRCASNPASWLLPESFPNFLWPRCNEDGKVRSSSEEALSASHPSYRVKATGGITRLRCSADLAPWIKSVATTARSVPIRQMPQFNSVLDGAEAQRELSDRLLSVYENIDDNN